MARILKKIKEYATGRTEEERKIIAERDKEIRKLALEAELKEREIQNVRLAQAKVRAAAKKKEMAMNRPRSFGFEVASPEYKNYGGVFGQPRSLSLGEKINTMKKKGKKGKKKPYKRYTIKEQIKPQRYDVLGANRWF